MTIPVAAGPSPLWFLSRGAGVVALLLLTLTVVLGVVEVSRWSTERWPRFIVDGLHRNVSLLALAVLTVHILTTVIDSFTPLSLKDAVIPFASSYRPLWVGLGALAFDLLLAVALTSLVRRRLGYGAWRTVHWVAYACWPLAVLHGLGTGSDASQPWMLALTVSCLVLVLWGCAWRISSGWPRQSELRVTAACVAVLFPIFAFIWLVGGPLGSHWAKRAGTPPKLLAAVHPAIARAQAAPESTLHFPLSAHLTGAVQQSQLASGLIEVDLNMKMSGGAKGPLDVRLIGQPLGNGGVQLTQGAVTLGPPIQPRLFAGRISALQGSHLRASVANAQGHSVRLALDLALNQASQTASGTVRSQGSPSARQR